MDTPPPPPPAATPAAPSQSNDKLLAVLCHLSYLLLSIIFPLIIWLVKKDESPYLAAQAKEALNWHITIFLAFVACGILSIVIIGLFLMPVVGIGGLIFAVIAAIKTNDGVDYKYPFCLRLIK
jgi:uncharacterized Tic20 family protein